MAVSARVPCKAKLAKRMRDYRFEAGVTAQEAGWAVGKKATTIYKYESGRLRVSESDLLSLLAFYDVDLSHAFEDASTSDVSDTSRKKDASSLLWRRLKPVFESLDDRQQRLLLEVARSMARD